VRKQINPTSLQFRVSGDTLLTPESHAPVNFQKCCGVMFSWLFFTKSIVSITWAGSQRLSNEKFCCQYSYLQNLSKLVDSHDLSKFQQYILVTSSNYQVSILFFRKTEQQNLDLSLSKSQMFFIYFTSNTAPPASGTTTKNSTTII
jgi:hypothetical protein